MKLNESKAEALTARILTVAAGVILLFGVSVMTVITPVGMNPDGQFAISQPGDVFTNIATVANTGSYNDLINQPSLARATSSLTLSLVGTGATGTQISSTKDADIKCTISTSATATIAGAATSTVTLKICATNNVTEANWTTVAVSETSQSYSLAVAIQGVTGGKGQLYTAVPGGWFVKLVNTGSGTHSETYISGQQTIYG